MDKSEKETHDFMNVESFSQLPFIRTSPPKSTTATGGIRLFGIEFSDKNHAGRADSEPGEKSEDMTGLKAQATLYNDESNKTNNTNNRRFECHYCCRNFPTSQALGGHQNAHKRERQNAKRAHLQSAMAHGALSSRDVYGLVNYRSTPNLGSTYYSCNGYNTNNNNNPSWYNNSSSSSSYSFSNGYSRIYDNINHHYRSTYSSQQPINGSPLGFCRTPNVTGGRSSHPLPLLSGDDLRGGSSSSTTRDLQFGSNNRESTKSSNVQDHVSLDLHL